MTPGTASLNDAGYGVGLAGPERLPYNGRMYKLCFQREFTARHRLVGGDWGAENELHAHPYRVEWELRSSTLDAHGYLVDLVDVERALVEAIGRYGGAVLNDLPEFGDQNPSLERFARILWERLSPSLPAHIQGAVRLWENTNAWAGFQPPQADALA
jgi:6-pyruvoyltetrahydropterin/6-carboxytetrahydropterin synthase